MTITAEQVKRVATLARLDIKEEKIAEYTQNLTRILTLVEQMNNINTDQVEPLSHPQDVELRMREDEITETDQHTYFQSIAPAVENDLYLVPKVIE